LEAVRRAQLRQAGILGVDEHHPAIIADAEFVDVEIADGLGVARHIAAVETAVRQLVRPQHVLEAPDLVEATQVDALGVADHAHGALEDAFEEGHPALLVAADQVDAPGLVGGDGQGHAVHAQPSGQAARAALLDVELGQVLGCLRLARLRLALLRLTRLRRLRLRLRRLGWRRLGDGRLRTHGLQTGLEFLFPVRLVADHVPVVFLFGHLLLQLFSPSLAPGAATPGRRAGNTSPAVAHHDLAADVAVHRAAVDPVQAAREGPAVLLQADAQLQLGRRAVRHHAARQRRIPIDDEAALAVGLVDRAQAAVRGHPQAARRHEAVLQAQAHAQTLGLATVQHRLGQAARPRVHVVDLDPGVLQLRPQRHTTHLPARVAGLQVEGTGIAAGHVLGAGRAQAGLEVHPAPGRVEVVVTLDPGGVQAGGIQVGVVTAGAAQQAALAIGPAQQDAVVQAVADGEVHAHLDAVGLLRE